MMLMLINVIYDIDPIDANDDAFADSVDDHDDDTDGHGA